MYEIYAYYPKQIILDYVVVFGALALTYPVARLVMTSISRGLSKWR